MDIRWHEVTWYLVVPFVLLGPLLVLGIFLQARSIVEQSKSFSGFLLKMMSLLGLVGASVAVRNNVVPYLVLFMISMCLSLLVASLARKSLMR